MSRSHCRTDLGFLLYYSLIESMQHSDFGIIALIVRALNIVNLRADAVEKCKGKGGSVQADSAELF